MHEALYFGVEDPKGLLQAVEALDQPLGQQQHILREVIALAVDPEVGDAFLC